jgi:hypothetical protein
MNEDSFEMEQQRLKLAEDHILRVMQECKGYTQKQVSLVIRNVPALKNISESVVKDLYEQLLEKLIIK